MKSFLKSLALGLALLTTSPLSTVVQAIDRPTTPSSSTAVAVLATDPTALTGASSGAFTFLRSGPTNADLNVPFVYSGTAILGTDFNDAISAVTPPGARYVTIPKGFYATDLVILPKLNPNLRGNKTVDVTLDSVVLGTVSVSVDQKYTKAEVRIVDDTFNDSSPTVSLSAPANNSTFTLPATVLMKAEVSDVDDTIQKVSFYAEDTFLGSATTSPFIFSWVNPQVGEYDLFARAVDAAGKSTLSQAVHIKVTGVTPTVTITAPQDKATIDPNSDVPVKVQATGIGPLTVRISYDGSHLLGEVKKAPYELTWRDVPSGKHTLTAQVTDSAGQTASASIQISVVDQPPSVQITSPANGTNFASGVPIALSAKATDPDDPIKDVTFWVNHRVLGKATVSATDPSSYQFNWTEARPNFYLIQAIATNSNGTKTTSDAVYISVLKK